MFVGMDLHKNYLQIAVMDAVLENSRMNNNLKQRVFEIIVSIRDEIILEMKLLLWRVEIQDSIADCPD
jgi:hypothetical protein